MKSLMLVGFHRDKDRPASRIRWRASHPVRILLASFFSRFFIVIFCIGVDDDSTI